MSLSRFFVPASQWPASLTPLIPLPDDEAQHCSRVLRKTVGDAVEIFDGQGRVARAEIASLTKSLVQVKPLFELPPAQRGGSFHLLPAFIKAEPFEWLLEKATELGAASVTPLLTARTIIHLDAAQTNKKLVKWRRHMVEAAKQCHTPWIPELREPARLLPALSGLPRESVRLLPALSESTRRLHEVRLPADLPVYAIIGPEGDFTPEEEALAQQHGFQPITLGSLILRAETAAICLLSQLSHEWQRQNPAT